VRNRWSDQPAGASGIDALVAMSRLVGAEPSLLLWGGGNTSLKQMERDYRGKRTHVLRVKGSGSDLKSVLPGDFPGVRLEDVLPLEERDAMTDEEMVAYLTHTLIEPDSPRPSIETLLHAFLPDAAVLHSHADAIVALTNTQHSQETLRRALGDAVVAVAYRRPGFLLSKEVAEAVRENPRIQGVVLANHGLVTWGASLREAYDRHIDLVSRAEDFAQTAAGGRRVFGGGSRAALGTQARRTTAARIAPALRGMLSRRQRVVLRYDDAPDILDFLASPDAQRLSQIGPATPDHLLNTKRLPVFVPAPDPTDIASLRAAVQAGVDEYRERYLAYVSRNNGEAGEPLPAEPRVILIPGLGMWTTGRDPRAARVAGEIYHHTIAVMAAAEAVDAYASLSERDAFEAEYWPMELYKLTLQPAERPLARQIAIVTGAASGIGRAIAERFVAEGAQVVLADLDARGAVGLAEALCVRHGADRCLGLGMDVTNAEQVAAAFAEVRRTYGGLDILVSNAGIAPSAAIVDLELPEWERSLAVNATGHFLVTREAMRLMQEQGIGGSLIYVASKNVTAPGAEFGAYSAAKAAEAQLARIAAIEGGAFGIRANVLNPDAIFEGSGLFSAELRERRARAHGVAPEQLEEFYQQRNLLRTRVLAEDVAEAALFFASARSAKTTGAMLPVDGGVREAFPR
jgi:rhamnulose-1-phosphate aldolase/alcohol dehydrogenase